MSDDSDDFNEDEFESRGISRTTGKPKKLVRGRPFHAGQSGNPGGKPKVEGIQDVRKAAREWTQLALETLVEVCGDVEASSSARVSAAGTLLDRGWGKAPQTVVIDGEVNVEGLTDTSLDEITRREIAAFLGKGLAGASEAESSGKLN
jgi:hypothetical protein